ncbi:MAG: choice-of-anchor D domain-containing protein [Saprospiraceae bacterium]
MPRTFFDIMNYCPGSKTWIAPEQYRLLMNNIAAAVSSKERFATLSRRAADAPADDEYLGVSGAIPLDGGNARLNPAVRFRGEGPPQPQDPEGIYCLRFSNPSGPLSDYCFTPALTDPETEEPLARNSFSFQVPYVSGATRMALVKRDGGAELASLSAGSGPPAVTITSPAPGDQLTGSTTISWNATDPGGQPLSYRVHYSNDGGTTWYPLTLRAIAGSQFVLDTAGITGGSQVFFRVMALNGLETTYTTVGPLKIDQTPRLAVANSTLDLGNVLRGQTYTSKVELTNTGSGPYTVSSVAIDNEAFQSPSAPFDIWPGAEPQFIPITFQSATTGAVTATLTINGDTKVTLKAAVFDRLAPKIAAAPATLNFGTANAGDQKDLNVTISNSGQASLNVKTISFTGNAAFGLPQPFTALAIAPGKTAEIAVRWKPASGGAQSGTMTIASDDPDAPSITVSLSGSAVAIGPQGLVAEIAPSSLDFGLVSTGQTKDLQITVRNTGASRLDISSANVTAGRYSLVNTVAPFSVDTGFSRAITVRFAPTAAGSATGIITFLTNDTAKPSVTVTLTGSGQVQAGPETATLSVDDGSYEITGGVGAGAPAVYFLNRLTPARYPATLKTVQILFPNEATALKAGDPIRVLLGANPSGSATINGIQL